MELLALNTSTRYFCVFVEQQAGTITKSEFHKGALSKQ